MMISRREILRLGVLTTIGAAGGSLGLKEALADEDLTQYFLFPERESCPKPVLEEAPARIVEDGLIRAGLFKSPVREMNLLESRILDNKPTNWLGLPRLMEWVGAGMAHPEWYFGLIIVDAKTASLPTLYGFNRKTGAYFSHGSLSSAKRVKVAESTWNDVTCFRKPGFNMEVNHRLEQGFHKVKIDIHASAKKPAVKADLIWHEDLEKIQPLVLMSPLGGTHFMYNHKAQMPVEGAMKVGDQEMTFDPGRDIANMDELKSCAGLKNKYNWFNFGGFDPKGRIVGLNASHSEQRRDHYWTENCIWAGNRLSLVGPVRFEFSPKDIMKPWRAYDEEGRVDVTFYPEGGKTINLSPLGKYYQKCGRFRGALVDGSGETHAVNDYYGCAEYMNVLN